jgi:HSP20 family protein
MIVRHRQYPTTFGSAFDRSLDRTFDQIASSFFEPRRRSPIVDAEWRDDELVLTVDLPGVPADAVSVEVAGRNLTISARTDALDWSRQLQLGTSLDPSKVTARHLDGQLTVTVGAVDAPQARSIAIDTTAPAPALEATSEDSSAEQVTDAPVNDQPTETNAAG